MTGGGTVIVYHGVEDCPPGTDPYRLLMPLERFAWQLAYLARRRRVVPLEDLLAGDARADRPAVAITFDDGYRNLLTHALPMLDRHGFPATSFVPSGWIGRDMGWEPFEPDDWPLPIMTADELRRLADLGHGVESHGHAHVRLGAVGYDDALADVTASLDTLEEVLGTRPRHLAYPFGSHAEPARRAAADAGLAGAFGIGQVGQGRFAMERVTIRPTDSRATFAYKTSGRYLSSRATTLAPVYRAVRPLVLLARRRKK